jgi:hypothetical protein
MAAYEQRVPDRHHHHIDDTILIDRRSAKTGHNARPCAATQQRWRDDTAEPDQLLRVLQQPEGLD